MWAQQNVVMACACLALSACSPKVPTAQVPDLTAQQPGLWGMSIPASDPSFLAKFYAKVLGVTFSDATLGDGVLCKSADLGKVWLRIVPSKVGPLFPGAPGPNGYGDTPLSLFGVTFPTRQELREALKRVEEYGARIISRVADNEGDFGAVIVDPEGNVFDLIWR